MALRVTDLRYPFRTDETSCFNVPQPSLPEPVDQFCFDGRRNRSRFVLEAITRANFDHAHEVGFGGVIPTNMQRRNKSQAGGASLVAPGGTFDCARQKHLQGLM